MFKIKVTKEMYNGKIDLSVPNPKIIYTYLKIDKEIMKRIKYGCIEKPDDFYATFRYGPDYFIFYQENKLYYFEQLGEKVHYIFEFNANILTKITTQNNILKHYNYNYTEILNDIKQKLSFFKHRNYYPYDWIIKDYVNDRDVISFLKNSHNKAERKLGKKLESKTKEKCKVKITKEMYDKDIDLSIKNPRIINTEIYISNRNKRKIKLGFYPWYDSYDKHEYNNFLPAYFVFFEKRRLYFYDYHTDKLLLSIEFKLHNKLKINVNNESFLKDYKDSNILYFVKWELLYLSKFEYKRSEWIGEFTTWDEIQDYQESGNIEKRKNAEKILKNELMWKREENRIETEENIRKTLVTKEMDYHIDLNKKEKTKELTLNLRLTPKEYKRLTYGYFPDMCDPLFVFSENNIFYFYFFGRGELIFKAEIYENNPKIKVHYTINRILHSSKNGTKTEIKNEIKYMIKCISIMK